MSGPDLVGVVRAVWFETGGVRAGLHRLLRVRNCDVDVVVEAIRISPRAGAVRPVDGSGLLLMGDCMCRDLLVDLLVEADRFLSRHGPTLHNVPAAVRVHLRTRAIADWTRRRRVDTGAQARTDRIRSGARARALPDDFHRALLEYVVAEAGSLAPLRDETQLRSRLAELVAAEFGGAPDDWRSRVDTGLRTLEGHYRGGRAVAGSVSWWDRYVDQPLGRRACPDVLSLDAVPLDVVLHLTALSAAEPESELGPGRVEVLDAVVAAARASLVQRGGGDPARRLTAVLRSVTADLVERRALADDVAADFIADRARVMAAVDELITLVVA